MHIKEEAIERHTLAVVVDNEAGVLARIAGLFTARGYNIESLTVSEVTADKAVSRVTIVTSASPATLEQIVAQLERLIPVHSVTDLTAQGAHVERELALVKVRGSGDHRIEALRLADVYRARVVDATTSSFVFEVTGGREKIDSFVSLMQEVGLIEGRPHRHRRHPPAARKRPEPYPRPRLGGGRTRDHLKCVSITITTPT